MSDANTLIESIKNIKPANRDEAMEAISALYRIETATQDKLAEIGLEYNEYVYFGGKSLELGPEGEGLVQNEAGEWVNPDTGEVDHWAGRYQDYERGEWVSSSYNC